jgi:predicted transcriptional regulator
MEVHLSPDKEARLQQFAARAGKATAQVVEEAVDRMLEYDAHFLKAVEEGRAEARRMSTGNPGIRENVNAQSPP